MHHRSQAGVLYVHNSLQSRQSKQVYCWYTNAVVRRKYICAIPLAVVTILKIKHLAFFPYLRSGLKKPLPTLMESEGCNSLSPLFSVLRQYLRQEPSQQYFSGPFHWATEYRSPYAQPIGKQSSIACKSLSLSDNSEPAANSSRWETDRVPGIGRICSPWCKSHAMASEAVLCPISLASNRNRFVAAMLRL